MLSADKPKVLKGGASSLAARDRGSSACPPISHHQPSPPPPTPLYTLERQPGPHTRRPAPHCTPRPVTDMTPSVAEMEARLEEFKRKMSSNSPHGRTWYQEAHGRANEVLERARAAHIRDEVFIASKLPDNYPCLQ